MKFKKKIIFFYNFLLSLKTSLFFNVKSLLFKVYLIFYSNSKLEFNQTSEEVNILVLRRMYLKYSKNEIKNILNKKKSPEGIIVDGFNNILNEKKIILHNYYIDSIEDSFFPLSKIADFFYFLKKKKIKIIFLSQWTHTAKTIPWSLINKLSKYFCLINLYHDTCDFGDVKKNLEKTNSLITYNFCSDNPKLYGLNSYKKISYLPWVAFSLREKKIQQRNFNDKDIDIVFLGMGEGYRDYRRKFLDKINSEFKDKKKVIKLYLNRQNKISNNEYREIMSRAKIIINFSKSLSYDQLKYRVFEAINFGALLFESENDQIKEHFCEFEDYIPFLSIDDLVRKINFYLNDLKSSKKIAESSQIKFNHLVQDKKYKKKLVEIISKVESTSFKT